METSIVPYQAQPLEERLRDLEATVSWQRGAVISLSREISAGCNLISYLCAAAATVIGGKAIYNLAEIQNASPDANMSYLSHDFVTLCESVVVFSIGALMMHVSSRYFTRYANRVEKDIAPLESEISDILETSVVIPRSYELA